MNTYFAIVTAFVSKLQRHKVDVAVQTEKLENLNELAINVVKKHYFIPTDSVSFEVSAPEKSAFFGGLNQKPSYRDGTGEAWIMAERK